MAFIVDNTVCYDFGVNLKSTIIGTCFENRSVMVPQTQGHCWYEGITCTLLSGPPATALKLPVIDRIEIYMLDSCMNLAYLKIFLYRIKFIVSEESERDFLLPYILSFVRHR